jgi:hypothetical protein
MPFDRSYPGTVFGWGPAILFLPNAGFLPLQAPEGRGTFISSQD